MTTGHSITGAEQIARAFVDARRTGVALADYPGDMPGSLADGYRVQDAALALSSRAVAGWKVGKIDPPFDGTNRLAGPIFADQIVIGEGGDGAYADMPVFADGFAAAEAEFLLRLGTAPDPAKAQYSDAEARALVDAVHVGIEIASSPFPGINANGPAVTVSDFGNNNGLIVGAAVTDWRDDDIGAWPVALLVNDVEVGRARAATMLDGPFGAVRFLLEHMAARGIAMPAGTWVSTGAITGVHPVAVGDTVRAAFDDRLTLGCMITAR